MVLDDIFQKYLDYKSIDKKYVPPKTGQAYQTEEPKKRYRDDSTEEANTVLSNRTSNGHHIGDQ